MTKFIVEFSWIRKIEIEADGWEIKDNRVYFSVGQRPETRTIAVFCNFTSVYVENSFTEISTDEWKP